MLQLNAYYQLKGGTGVQRRGVYAGPYKIYSIEFLAKKGFKISHPVTEVQGKKIKGLIVYKDITSDSGNFHKNDTITLSFPDRNMNDNVFIPPSGSKLISYKKEQKDEYIIVSFYLNSNKAWVRTRVYEKKRPENEPMLE